MNARKLRKLCKNPAMFMRDMLINRYRPTNSTDAKLINRTYLMTPREKPLHLNLLVAFLEKKNLTGLIKYSLSNNNVRLCIPSQARNAFLNAVAEFCVTEGADMRYKIARRLTTFKDVKSLLENFATVDKASIKIISLRSLEEITFFVEFWSEQQDFFDAPSPNLISKRLWKSTVTQHSLFVPGNFSDFSNILKYPHATAVMFPIDLVFTWVNSDDPDWQKIFSQHAPQIVTDGTSKSRFHSRDELMYALRSWDQHASFVNHIFIVSNCAPPQWLDLSNDRITWVHHQEIIPATALPTFSSHAIETCLHKIPGLADHFIYSNDDNLLMRNAHATDFFYPNSIAKIRVEPYGMVNGEPVEGHPDYLNAARNANRLIENVFSRSTTQLVTHSPQPLRKDILDKIERQFPQELSETTHNKFRKFNDVSLTGYLHAHYAMLSGRAVFDETPVQLIQQNHNFKQIFADLILARQKKVHSLPLSICLNDGANSHQNKAWNRGVSSFLQAFFPEKSSFER